MGAREGLGEGGDNDDSGGTSPGVHDKQLLVAAPGGLWDRSKDVGVCRKPVEGEKNGGSLLQPLKV